MSQMGNLEKLGILVIVILVVVVGVVVITPKETLFPEIPEGEIAQNDELLEPLPPPPSPDAPLVPAPGIDPFEGTSNVPDLGTKGDAAKGSSPVVPPTPLPPVPTEPQYRDVMVLPGDTLEKIARRELGAGSRWPEIVQANPGLEPKRLKPNQKLRIPVTPGSVPTPAKDRLSGTAPAVDPLAPPASEPSREPATAAEKVYVVQRGDTLSDIAREQMGSASKVPDLVAANQDKLKGTDTIQPGMRLRIPGAKGTATAPITARKSESAPATEGAARTYTVQKGDSLSSIASRMLGATNRWREIVRANESVLHGGTDLQPGMVLTIPADVSAR